MTVIAAAPHVDLHQVARHRAKLLHLLSLGAAVQQRREHVVLIDPVWGSWLLRHALECDRVDRIATEDVVDCICVHVVVLLLGQRLGRRDDLPCGLHSLLLWLNQVVAILQRQANLRHQKFLQGHDAALFVTRFKVGEDVSRHFKIINASLTDQPAQKGDPSTEQSMKCALTAEAERGVE